MGVAAAFTGLYERYWQLLYNYAQRKGSSPEDAEDLVQGFFVDEGMHLLERLAEEARRGRFFQPDRRFRSLLLPSFQMYFRRCQERYAEGLPQMRYGGGSRLTRNPQKG
jgi:hypothetical protein